MATKLIEVPMPTQWTVLLAGLLAEASKIHKLHYVWSAAEAGGIAMQWQRPQAVLAKRNANACYTLLIHNDGVLVFCKERNGFGNTDGFAMEEWDIHDLVNEIICEVKEGF